MKGRKILTTAAVTVALLGWGAVTARTAQEPSSNKAANSGASEQQVPSPGQPHIDVRECRVDWADVRVISSKIPGRIERRLVNDGSRVEKDQVLAVLDDRDARLEYEAQYILGESDLAERAQEIELREYVARKETAEVLYPSRAISREEYRLSTVRRDASQVKLEQEREKHHVEKIKSDRTKIFLDDHTIVSPMRGIVQKCFKREKESVTGGDLQMFRIVATDRLWVEGRVPLRDLYRVRPGQAVEVRLVMRDANDVLDNSPELPEEKRVFRGTIVFKDPEIDFANQQFRVRAEVDNQDELMWAGQSATMRIFLSPPTPEANSENNPGKRT